LSRHARRASGQRTPTLTAPLSRAHSPPCSWRLSSRAPSPSRAAASST
jgi:hypothetical protein